MDFHVKPLSIIIFDNMFSKYENFSCMRYINKEKNYYIL